MFQDDATSSSSSSTDNFKPDALIWAKMKGFPPWPAKVLPQSSDATVPGRVRVQFFGTGETAFMKASDCSDYISNKHLHEIPRKHKGFNDGVHEIRVQAGIESPTYRDPIFFPQEVPSTSTTEDLNSRNRRASFRFSDAILDFGRKRSNSGSTKTRSRASSTHSTLKFLHKHMNKRKRFDSESSNGSRVRQMISGGLGNDPLTGLFDLALETDSHWNLHENDNLFGMSDDARSTRSKRSRGFSKVFEEYKIEQHHQPNSRNRNRSGSNGDGRRSRLISGVSDIFEELLNSGDIHAVAADFANTLEEMPSESSEINFSGIIEPDGIPETSTLLPFCTKCGNECKMEGNRWRCTSKHCQEWHDMSADLSKPETSKDIKTKEDTIEEEEIIDVGTVPIREGSVLTNKTAKKEGKTKIKLRPKGDKNIEQKKQKKRVQVVSPQRQLSVSPPSSPKNEIEDSPSKKQQGRPHKYNVIKTPLINPKTGLRHCNFCSGQVRPQMCGGNKHRWRCVDKKCRKWYGWVKACDEIPMDLRKGRLNSVIGGRIKLKKRTRIRQITEKSEVSISSAGEAALAVAHLDTASMKSGGTGRSSPLRTLISVAEMKKNKAAAESLIEMKNLPKSSAVNKKINALKKKTIRKDTKVKQEEEQPKRSVSPLTQQEIRYKPCGMEKRARWWLSERRKADPSPERELQTGMADSAAAFRILSHAFRAAAVTRADEVGTVNGSLDLMMDSLLGAMGPLLSLLQKLPATRPKPETVKQLWDASAVHIPIFQ